MTAIDSSDPVPETAGWGQDPYGRYELRWWDGATWTPNVHSGGHPSVDPLGGAPPEATTTGRTLDVALSASDLRPGDEVWVTCTVHPWPSPKAYSIILSLHCEKSQLVWKNVSDSPWVQKFELNYQMVETTVSQVVVQASQIDASGSCTVPLVLPLTGPPSTLGYRTADWTVVGRLVGKRPFQETVSVPITVGQMTVEQVRAGRRSPSGDEPEEPQEDEHRDVRLSLANPTTARDDVLRGALILELDPLAFAESQPYFTKRGRRKALDKADVSEVAPLDGELTVECIRRCPPAADGQLGEVTLWSEMVPVGLPAVVDVRTPYEFPFELKIPARAHLERSTEGFLSGIIEGKRSTTEIELPPTSYGARVDPDGTFHAHSDDEFLWRLTAAVKTSGSLDLHYSGGNPSSPLRATTEILVT